MNTMSLVWRELLGMFVDDQSFAISILCVIVTATGIAFVSPGNGPVVGSVLFAGSIVALVFSVGRSRIQK